MLFVTGRWAQRVESSSDRVRLSMRSLLASKFALYNHIVHLNEEWPFVSRIFQSTCDIFGFSNFQFGNGFQLILGSSGITSAPNYKSLEHSPNNSREKCGSSDFKSQEHAKLVDAANENIRQLTGNLDAVNKDLQANEFALRMLLVSECGLGRKWIWLTFINLLLSARKTQAAEQRRHTHCDAEGSAAT